MANIQWMYDTSNPILAPVATAQAALVGDMVALVGNTIVRAEDIAWGTAIATPTAPTVANSAIAVGSPLTNALTAVKITYQFAWGEGALSAAGTATPTAGAELLVSGAPLIPATNALYTNIYVETAAGSGVFKLWGTTLGPSVLVGSYGAGQQPVATALSDATTVTQYAFAQAFAGISGQQKIANTALIYGNSIANQIRVSQYGVFRFPTVSASYNVGQFLAPVKAAGNALISQQVGLVATVGLAIAQVVQATVSQTTVLGRLLNVPLSLS